MLYKETAFKVLEMLKGKYIKEYGSFDSDNLDISRSVLDSPAALSGAELMETLKLGDKMLDSILDDLEKRGLIVIRRPVFNPRIISLHDHIVKSAISITEKGFNCNDKDFQAILTKNPDIVYFITYEHRTIIINDNNNNRYALSKQDYNSPGHNFFEEVFKQPRKKVTVKMLKAYGIKRSFNQLVNDLNFKGEIRKVFFPNVSKDAVMFQNDITKEDLAGLDIDIKKLERELIKLPKV